MNLIFSALVMLLWLSAPQSVVVASEQGQKTSIKVLERGDDWQCPSVEEREAMRNEIHQIVASVIASSICNGTPGWRRIAFINMTSTSYDCPTGLRLTAYSKRTCGRSHTTAGCSSTSFSVGGLPYSRVCGRIRTHYILFCPFLYKTQKYALKYNFSKLPPLKLSQFLEGF